MNMEATHCVNKVQEDCKKSISEAVDRHEIHQVRPTRIYSSIQDRHEISPMRRLPSGLISAQQTSGLEDIDEEDNEDDGAHSTLNQSSCTTFTTLPSHTTPPSKQNKVRNPFDAALIKRLHLPIFSPSVFKRVISPTQDTPQFTWTIEDVAKIQPAPIEEYQLQQYEQAVDSETELKAQEAIDHYFCNTHVVCSPWGPQAPEKTSSLLVETNGHYSSDKQTPLNSRDDDGEEAKSGDFSCSVSAKKEASTQTVLTLPPELPPVLESALKPYFTFAEDPCECTDEANLSATTLRRKLFFHEENNQKMSISSVRSSPFSMQVECEISSPAQSGLLLPTSSRIISPSAPLIHSRTYGTPHSGSKLIASPEVSPICSVQQNKSITRLSFSERMMLMDNSASFNPSVSPPGTVPIQHEDDHCPSQNYTHFLLPSSSSAVITLETSSPVKGETESLNSTSAMITSETSTPVKGKCLPTTEDISMESLYFTQLQKKLKEFENADNHITEGELTNLNSFTSHSTENSLSNGSNMHSHDTGYQTGSVSCNMTSINSGASSAFSSLISVSKNWNSTHLKSVGDKHVGISNDDFGNNKYNIANKGSTVALQDSSLWLPGSMHIVSSTPTKASDKECY